MTLACVALSSCVKNEISTPGQKGVRIGFASPVMYSTVDTKANFYGEIGSHKYEGSATTYTYPQSEDFKIFAVQHVGNLVSWDEATACEFNGQDISYDPSLDAWAPKNPENGSYYYWPTGYLLSFAALSPADLEQGADCRVSYSEAGLEIENFEISDSPAGQFDLLFSKRTVNTSSTTMLDDPNYYSGIRIDFKHALTSIHFAIQKQPEVAEDVVLTGIELVNVKKKGSFSENIADDTPYASDPEWNLDDETADYVPFSGEMAFLEQQGQLPKSLLLMPQDLTDDVELHISYTVVSQQNNITKFTKVVKLNTYPSGNPVTKWQIGSRYVYNIVYGTASQKHDVIFFSPSTEGWVNASTIEIVL